MKEQQPVEQLQELTTQQQNPETIRRDANKDYALACLAGGLSLAALVAADYFAVNSDAPVAIECGAGNLFLGGMGFYERRVANDGFQRALMLEQAHEYQGIIDTAMNQFGEDVLEAGEAIADAIDQFTAAMQSGEAAPSQPNDAEPTMPAANRAE